MRHVILLISGRRPQKLEVEEWFKRFKLAGSALSTTRMCLRLGMGIETVGYFIKQLRNYFKQSKCAKNNFFRQNRLGVQLNQEFVGVHFRFL
jgi:hypothetical protein